jgi:hypothetical protein
MSAENWLPEMMAETVSAPSSAVPAPLEDGPGGRADLWPWGWRILNWLTDQKEHGAAYLMFKVIFLDQRGTVFGHHVDLTPTDAERLQLDQELVDEETRLVKEVVHKERRAARSDEAISPAEAAAAVLGWHDEAISPAEAAAAVLGWQRKLYTTIQQMLTIAGKEMIDGVHVFSENSGQVAMQRVIDHFGKGQMLPRALEVLTLLKTDIPATCTSLRDVLELMKKHRNVAWASDIDVSCLLAAKFLKFIQQDVELALVSTTAATPKLDFDRLIQGLQKHLDIHGDVRLKGVQCRECKTMFEKRRKGKNGYATTCLDCRRK